MYAQESGTSFWYQKLSLNRAVFYMVHISSLLSRPTAWWCLLFISLRHPRLYGHVLLHWFSFIFRWQQQPLILQQDWLIHHLWHFGVSVVFHPHGQRTSSNLRYFLSLSLTQTLYTVIYFKTQRAKNMTGETEWWLDIWRWCNDTNMWANCYGL